MKHLTLYNPKFKEQHTAFVKQQRQQGYSKTTVDSRDSCVKEFLWWLEEQKISSLKKVNQTLVEQYFQYMEHRPNKRRPGGLSNVHLKRHAECVILFMEFFTGVKRGQSGIQISYKIERNICIEILTVDEVQAMFDAADDNIYGLTDKAILACLYGLGMRLSELNRCNDTDVSLTTNSVEIKQTKNGYSREIPLSPKVQSVLEEYRYRARSLMLPLDTEEQALIISVRGQRLGVIRIEQRMKELGQKAGISKNTRPHILRHSIGTHLIAAGVSVFEVSQFLGHRSLDSTQRYVHLNQQNNGEKNG